MSTITEIRKNDILVLRNLIWGIVTTIEEDFIEIYPVNEVMDDEYPVRREDIMFHFRVSHAEMHVGEDLVLILEWAE